MMPYRTFRFNECGACTSLFKSDKGINVECAFIKRGALLANGIVFSGIHGEVHPAHALLTAEAEEQGVAVEVGGHVGIGTHAGPGASSTTPVANALAAALSLGFVLVGTGNTPPVEEFISSMDVVADMVSHLHSIDVNEPNARFEALGIGLISLSNGRGMGMAKRSSNVPSIFVPTPPLCCCLETAVELRDWSQGHVPRQRTPKMVLRWLTCSIWRWRTSNSWF
ncbi:hypothetical protein niasHT_036123 [Heterodera trifolii]|uniref:Uncharacterized protein n=1 Tax=Heterodera trifolii TaxID=157864 RepID=A0ABD2I8A1_9BILA